MSARDERYRNAQLQLRGTVQGQLSSIIAAIGNSEDPESQEAMDLYNSTAFPVVAGGQRQAGTLAIAYMGEVAPARTRVSPTRALANVLIDSEAAVARSPILRLWSDLSTGVEILEAIDAASSYAGALASGDLQVAERSGLTEGARATGREITGWRKQLSADPCEWCRKVGAERVYNSAESVPFHARDAFGVAPVLEEETERIATGYRVLRESGVS